MSFFTTLEAQARMEEQMRTHAQQEAERNAQREQIYRDQNRMQELMRRMSLARAELNRLSDLYRRIENARVRFPSRYLYQGPLSTRFEMEVRITNPDGSHEEWSMEQQSDRPGFAALLGIELRGQPQREEVHVPPPPPPHEDWEIVFEVQETSDIQGDGEEEGSTQRSTEVNVGDVRDGEERPPLVEGESRGLPSPRGVQYLTTRGPQIYRPTSHAHPANQAGPNRTIAGPSGTSTSQGSQITTHAHPGISRSRLSTCFEEEEEDLYN